MASIRKRGSSYLLVVSMGYDYEGNRIRPKQKTVHPPEGLTPKQKEKWLKEQAVLFERECRSLPQEEVDRSITLAKYTELWLREIAPGKLAKSTLALSLIHILSSCCICVQNSSLVKQSWVAIAKYVSVRFFKRCRYPASKYHPAAAK